MIRHDVARHLLDRTVLDRTVANSIASGHMRTGKLMGTAELIRRLGVSKVRVQQLIKRPDWPAPIDEIAAGKIYWAAEVEAWIAEHRPRVDDGPEGGD